MKSINKELHKSCVIEDYRLSYTCCLYSDFSEQSTFLKNNLPKPRSLALLNTQLLGKGKYGLYST